MSRAPRPAGTIPALVTASHTDAATSTGAAISTPRSPVYPVPATVHGVPSQLTTATSKRPMAAACGHTVASRSGACGPCTASTARVRVVSVPPSASTTRAVFDAFGITSNTAGPSPSAGCHHTMMSSSTDASASSNRWVYCARPGAILPRSLVSVRCSWSWASAPSRRTVPRCDTSNTTASSRQARCSAIVPPRYSSGMSQPPNGTMRAPRLRWTESSGERSGVIPRRGR